MTEESITRVVRDFDPSAGVAFRRLECFGKGSTPSVVISVNRIRWWEFGKKALRERLGYVLRHHYLPAGVAVAFQVRA